MFRIGEFSRIAQVSIRMLRHYDQIGLLAPAHVDEQSGYRYYRADQLAEVNRILALQELGFTLEVVGRLTRQEISASEIAGMLRLERERAADDMGRLERRLSELDRRLGELTRHGDLADVDLVEKSVPPMPFLSTRRRVSSMDDAAAFIYDVDDFTADHALNGDLVAVGHGEYFDDSDIDIEVGVTTAASGRLAWGNDEFLEPGRLPAVDRMLSAMHRGKSEDGHRIAHAVIGAWLETHEARLAGPGREVFHGGLGSGTVEIQYPIADRG